MILSLATTRFAIRKRRLFIPITRTSRSSMAPNNRASSSSSSSPDVVGSDDVVISRIYLIRHGDRFDYADPSWLIRAGRHGALATDPPLSALGHRQARETADHLRKTIMMTTSASKNDGDDDVPDEGARSGGVGGGVGGGVVDAILVSPYLRAIQTACPASDVLGVPLHIEDGLSESHATDRLHLPSADVRFAYFPRVDPTYDPLLVVRPTPGHACRRTGLPCESFAGGYCRRMARLVTALESTYRGRTVVLFSHAASVALVAALTRRSMRDMKFAPCGIYQMERVDDGPWTLVRGGECNSGHVRENSPTTYPWGFSEKDFDGDDGIDFDYFVVDDEREKSKM